MNIEPVTELHKPAYPIVAAALAATLLTACDRKAQRIHPPQITSGLMLISEQADVYTSPKRTLPPPEYYRKNNQDVYVTTPHIRDNPE